MKNSINQLLNDIERKIQWGDINNWTTRDFENLSEQIFITTDQRLSVTTLKRVWGRAQASSQPSKATLDILAQFAGYEDWRKYQVKIRKSDTRPVRPLNRRVILASVLMASLITVSWLLLKSSPKEDTSIPTEDTNEVTFSFEKVTTGYPNTVVFRYDIGDRPYDSIFIQQSWDRSKRIDLEKSEGLVTATYYYPGYFNAKLVVDGQIVVEKDLYIPTQGWQAILVGPGKPYRYLTDEHLIRNEALALKPTILDELNNEAPYGIALNNLSPVPTFNSNNFILEATFRLAQATEQTLCKYFALTIIGTEEVLGIAFCDKGCVGDIALMLNGEMISGKNHDLSAFGVEPGAWVNCRIEIADQQIHIFLEGKEVFTHPYSSGIGNIGGVKCYFEGLPEIKGLKLSDNGEQLDLITSERNLGD